MVGDVETQALGPFDRLDRILDYKLSPKIEISCSTIGLSDMPMTHFTGNFGLILKPHSFSCITHISNTDGGTEPSGDGRTRTRTNGKNSPDGLEDAITNREDVGYPLYNELCVYDYEILGLFIALNSGDTQLSDLVKHFYQKTELFQLMCNGSDLIQLRTKQAVRGLKRGRSVMIRD
jgi:hypothetical protein